MPMPPALVLIVFIASCWLIWIAIGWLPKKLRDPVHITLAAAALYAVSFFVVTAFAVYMYVYLAGARSGLLPQAWSLPVLVLAIALIIALPGYATWRFFHLSRHRQHKPPTVRRVLGHKAPTAHRASPPGHKPPTVRRVPGRTPPRPRP